MQSTSRDLPFFEAHIVFLKADEVFISLFSKYIYFIDIFSKDLAAKFLEYIKINNHAINLVWDQQFSYTSIHSLRLAKLETLKI